RRPPAAASNDQTRRQQGARRAVQPITFIHYQPPTRSAQRKEFAMTRRARSFKNSKVAFTTVALAALMALANAASVFAGGFQLGVEAPDAAKTNLKDAVLVVRTFGCHQPADANVTVTAEGIVNGRRQSVPVELRADAKGIYSIRQQWPAEGKWVLVLTGAYNGMTSTVFVELGEK